MYSHSALPSPGPALSHDERTFSLHTLQLSRPSALTSQHSGGRPSAVSEHCSLLAYVRYGTVSRGLTDRQSLTDVKKPYERHAPDPAACTQSAACARCTQHNYTRCTPLVNTHPHPVAPAYLSLFLLLRPFARRAWCHLLAGGVSRSPASVPSQPSSEAAQPPPLLADLRSAQLELRPCLG